jgi:hypothetical protein
VRRYSQSRKKLSSSSCLRKLDAEVVCSESGAELDEARHLGKRVFTCGVDQDQHAAVGDLIVRCRDVGALDGVVDVRVGVEQRVNVLTEIPTRPFPRLGRCDELLDFRGRPAKLATNGIADRLPRAQLSGVQRMSPCPTVSVRMWIAGRRTARSRM